ncbi:hypothetical protein, partial [Helicobacter sp. 'CLO3_human']|uniref:hypothetical protein n=1 Tax=Helicobacter sp. 'CLO3_human' TaxID=2020249 RepID=UPI001315381D
MNVKNYSLGGATAFLASNKTLKKTFFKPVVASSLALLLGSTLYGQEANTDCIGSNNCTPIKDNITFKFGGDSGTTVDVTGSQVTFGSGVSKVTLKDTNFTEQEFNFAGKLMTINFNNQNSKTFELIAEKKQFKGNLSIVGGGTGNNFSADFKYGMDGYIDIGKDNSSSAKIAFTFGDSSSVKEDGSSTSNAVSVGDITIYDSSAEGSNTFTFKSDVITQRAWTHRGNSEFIFEKNATLKTSKEIIYTGYFSTTNTSASATFTFNGNATIQSENGVEGIAIQAAGNTDNKTMKNTLNFNGNNSTNLVEGIISATANINNNNSKRYAENNLIFGANTSVNTIKGKIEAAVGAYVSNNIKFNNTSGTNKIIGNISSDAGENIIAFANGASNTIEGKIYAAFNGDKNKGKNTIVFGLASQQPLSAENTEAKNAIIGSIDADAATNTITFKDGTTNFIQGDILARSTFQGPGEGINTITFENGTTNIIKGNVTANGGGTNNIKIVGKEASKYQEIGQLNTSIPEGLSFLAGNIETNGGTNNLIFENSIWLPNHIVSANKQSVSFPENLSGTLTNNGGTTNIVLRTSNASLNALGTSMFNVENKSGNVNVVVQGQVNIGANVSYASNTSGNTTFIFANSNDITTQKDGSVGDSFDSSSTDISQNKVLGVTYQDGVKLVLKDKTISNNDSFLK